MEHLPPDPCRTTPPHRPPWARLKAQAAPTPTGAKPGPLGSSARPQQPGSGQPKVEGGFAVNQQEPFLTPRMRKEGKPVCFYEPRRVSAKPPKDRLRSWLKMASTLCEDSAPPASPDCLKAQAAPTLPRAPLEHLGSSPWPQEPATGRRKVDDSPFSTTRLRTMEQQIEGEIKTQLAMVRGAALPTPVNSMKARRLPLPPAPPPPTPHHLT